MPCPFIGVSRAGDASDARDKVVRVLAQAVGAGASVRIAVQDDGVGMDTGTLERAFEPFFTTRADGHGSGLGLAMVRRVVEACAGVPDKQAREQCIFDVQVLGDVGAVKAYLRTLELRAAVQATIR